MTCNNKCIHYPVCEQKNLDFATIDECKYYADRPQGKWIPMNPDCRGYPEYFKCSRCGAYIYPNVPEKELDYNGCPYCFADMRSGAEK